MQESGGVTVEGSLWLQHGLERLEAGRPVI